MKPSNKFSNLGKSGLARRLVKDGDNKPELTSEERDSFDRELMRGLVEERHQDAKAELAKVNRHLRVKAMKEEPNAKQDKHEKSGSSAADVAPENSVVETPVVQDSTGVKVTITKKVKFDRKKYQKNYMRKRRAKAKAERLNQQGD